jgi:hypothetical protein
MEDDKNLERGEQNFGLSDRIEKELQIALVNTGDKDVEHSNEDYLSP